MRALGPVALLVLVLLAGCGGSDDAAAPETGSAQKQAGDVARLLEGLDAYHPEPWHDITEEKFGAAARDLADDWPQLGEDARLVGLMRLLALLGQGDGHSGIFPLDPAHDRELHLFPVRLYEFSDGLFVVAAPDRPELVGARLEAVAGVPVDDAVRAVEPLVPADNESSRAARLPQYLVVAEVLHGLGLTADAGPAELTLVMPDGAPRTATLAPVSASEYAASYPDLFNPLVPQGLPTRPEPPYLSHRLRTRWLDTLEGGGTVYAAYNVTLGSTESFARRLEHAASRPEVERVVLDLRHNPGGDTTTYAPLLDVLGTLDSVTVLVGRTTFSAAANLLAELEQRADLVLVGEPSGGSPNLFGDPVPVTLPESRLTAQVAGRRWSLAGEGDERTAFEPDRPIALSSADFFGGIDPVLEEALRP
ncbi:MAG: hypothetical protein ACRDNI_12370 [Gaiellaceae bacterium]